MWCSHCRQDVPALAASDSELAATKRCAQCGEAFSARQDTTAHYELDFSGDDPQGAGDFAANEHELGTDGDALDELLDGSNGNKWGRLFEGPPVDLHDWQFDEDLREAECAVLRCGGGALLKRDQESIARDDPTQGAITDWHAHVNLPPALPSDLGMDRVVHGSHHRPPLVAAETPESSDSDSGLISWSALSLGLMALVCGGVLLVWSFVTGRGDLWTIGMPLTIGGQAVFLLGVLLQMDGLWNSSKKTATALGDLDENLTELRHTAAMLGTTHSTSGASFYSHMAQNARPELLLADLKGQLDLLAMQMARRR